MTKNADAAALTASQSKKRICRHPKKKSSQKKATKLNEEVCAKKDSLWKGSFLHIRLVAAGSIDCRQRGDGNHLSKQFNLLLKELYPLLLYQVHSNAGQDRADGSKHQQ